MRHEDIQFLKDHGYTEHQIINSHSTWTMQINNCVLQIDRAGPTEFMGNLRIQKRELFATRPCRNLKFVHEQLITAFRKGVKTCSWGEVVSEAVPNAAQ